jgi:hypothetical protein
MRKLIVTATVIGLCLAFAPEKKLKVELRPQQWQLILTQLDQSAAPHTEVKLTTGWLISQLNEQLKDTTIKK